MLSVEIFFSFFGRNEWKIMFLTILKNKINTAQFQWTYSKEKNSAWKNDFEEEAIPCRKVWRFRNCAQKIREIPFVEENVVLTILNLFILFFMFIK